MTPLGIKIRDQIRSGGPISFYDFMSLALYDPVLGYYASGKASIGRQGDFFTNVSVGKLFGRLLGRQFLEIWEAMEKPGEFTLVEQGANNGFLARDILESLREISPDFFTALHYRIIEPFGSLEKLQRQTLQEFPNITWHASLTEAPEFTGIHFSNELIDAMPVHLVEYTKGEWRELYVDFSDNAFRWQPGDFSSSELEAHTKILPPIENYRTEINLAALQWIEQLSSKLKRGYALVIDYGFSHSDYYLPQRTEGTLSCYRKHQRTDDPFQHIGETDITAHINFTALVKHSEKFGFKIGGFTDQHHFMTGVGTKEFQDDPNPTPEKKQALRAFQMLMHPGLMGQSFQYLALQKETPHAPFSGFRFAANPKKLLGL